MLEVIGAVPRHEFVPASGQRFAYSDEPLPVGYGQTISQPFIVAFMTEQLDPKPTGRILEIGTGSGYQAAILSCLVAEVYAIEIIEPLARRAEANLKRCSVEQPAPEARATAWYGRALSSLRPLIAGGWCQGVC